MKISRIIGIIVGVFTLVIIISKMNTHEPKIILPNFSMVTDFTLLDHNQQIFHSKNLDNKVWIVNFFFTSCQGPCPLLMKNVKELQEKFKNNDKFHIISISADSRNDNPRILKAYAHKHSIANSQWTFLTGEHKKIINLARSVFKLPADDDPNLHTTRIVLIDHKQRIRGYYGGMDSSSLSKLHYSIKALLANDDALL